MSLTTNQLQNMHPVSSQDRIEALDITRGIAVLGILVMNIWSFGWPKEIFDYPPILSHMDGATLETWAYVHVFFEGSQRAVFSILFGAGTLMMLHRLEKKQSVADAKKIYRRRVFFLVLIGLFDAYIFMWPADILFVYGLCGFLLYYARKIKAKPLIIITILVFCIPTAIRTVEYQQVNHLKQSEAKEDIIQWQAKLEKARPEFDNEKIQKSITIMQEGSLWQVFKKQATGSLILQTIITVKWWFIDALGAMFIGMLLYKAGILTLQAPISTYGLMLLFGYGIGLPISVWETTTLITSNFAPVQHALTAFTYDIGRLTMAIGHLALIMIFCQSSGWSKIKNSLAAVGQMALSNYLAQSILCGIIFYSFGFGLYGKLPGYQLYYVVLAVGIIEIIWSIVWLRKYRFGPFEWLWRSLTYGKIQPLRHE